MAGSVCISEVLAQNLKNPSRTVGRVVLSRAVGGVQAPFAKRGPAGVRIVGSSPLISIDFPSLAFCWFFVCLDVPLSPPSPASYSSSAPKVCSIKCLLLKEREVSQRMCKSQNLLVAMTCRTCTFCSAHIFAPK